MIRHAGLIALRLGGGWLGALIEGSSGAGKSDLALRAIEAGFRLAADDRVIVWQSGGALFGRAPGPLTGLIEARGVGVLRENPITMARIVVVVSCVAADAVERMPDFTGLTIGEIEVPRLNLNPYEFSAAAKVRRAIEHLGGVAQQAYQAPALSGQGRAGTGDTH